MTEMNETEEKKVDPYIAELKIKIDNAPTGRVSDETIGYLKGLLNEAEKHGLDASKIRETLKNNNNDKIPEENTEENEKPAEEILNEQKIKKVGDKYVKMDNDGFPIPIASFNPKTGDLDIRSTYNGANAEKILSSILKLKETDKIKISFPDDWIASYPEEHKTISSVMLALAEKHGFKLEGNIAKTKQNKSYQNHSPMLQQKTTARDPR